MIRESFLRNIALEQVSNNEWDLPGIGTHEIGFGICPESGLILQSPSPKPEEIQAYYEETATYINPGREGKPSVAKEKDLNRFITIVKDVIGDIPEKVFQVGCSDGYTLNRFREAGSQNINGIDPSIASHNLANKLYGIKMESPDIRAGISLVLAALIAEGESEIENIEQIDRGYEDIANRLKSIGADIKRI